MPGGEAFSRGERQALDAAIRRAEQLCRFEFSVFVGRAEGEPRPYATRLHNSLVASHRTVLILLDPHVRALEVVTGGEVRERLTDREVEMATLAMTEEFAESRFVPGLTRGIALLAEHAQD